MVIFDPEIAGAAILPTPLWPAGHLPVKGAYWQLQCRLISANIGDWPRPARHPIFLLEGEMAGRPEGGASRRFSPLAWGDA
ncbi:hypothetical protein X755_28620 [Mesorhizobium sp. LNJC405B00]|nr:hypothetical protein X755_28620 [Mesorhizobium sp. LNJC405B00]